MSVNDDRITALAQDIYIARHNQTNDVTGTDLTAFQDTTISWVNQVIPEIAKAIDQTGKPVDWNFLRTNDATIATIPDTNTISYALPTTVRRLVMHPHRDLTIRHDGIVVASFNLVNPNQAVDNSSPYVFDTRSRATVVQRKLILSRSPLATEVNGTLTADTINYIPRLSHTDVSLLDLLDANLDIRQLFILGVLKHQVLPDIVQGGLTPNFAKMFDDYLQACIIENNASADADDADWENFGFVSGVSF